MLNGKIFMDGFQDRFLLFQLQTYRENRGSTMACSKYEYVKQYEDHRTIMLETYSVVRIDGRGFTKFCQAHSFKKPNDLRAIELMNEAAFYVCQKFKDIFLAYGQSDEYSFALSKETGLFNRRVDKIQTCIVSAFTAAYVHNWSKFFHDCPLLELPSFDARLVQYPNLEIVKDYFRWRQVDCHINNLYNTTFWCLVKKGIKNTDVENRLKTTNSGEKNEILFSEFNINYNDIEEVYRRGTIICNRYVEIQNQDPKKGSPKIAKELKISIREIKQAIESTGRIVKKLGTSSIEDDLRTCKDLEILGKELETIRSKYQQIEMKEAKGDKQRIKQKNAKIELRACHEDLINQEFWNSIKTE